VARTISRAVSYSVWTALTLLTQVKTAIIALYDEATISVAVVAFLIAREVNALMFQTAMMVLELGTMVVAPSIQQWHSLRTSI